MDMETAEAIEAIREEIRGLASPWKTRDGAASYLACDVTAIDKLRMQGVLTPKYFGTSPRYHRNDLDKALGKEKKPL